ncbi:MAG TPA: type I-E CRISPR-associated protein Cse1/CasA, partial [Caldilineaceae bacterium]|nr:type I-E CRISPR-associated protein Cse1/CasA [Caldilineaceae bacterium]
DAYFDQWRHRFDLFHPERPFYQVDDPRVQPKSVVSLKYGVGFLHDQHFDHDGEATGFSFSPGQAAQAVVTLQAFGLGGLSGIEEKHTDAPCANGVVFFVRGDTLKETLLLNMPAYPQELFFRHTDGDAPSWEQENPFADARTSPNGLLDYLTWQSRRPFLYPRRTEGGDVVVADYKLGPGLRLSDDDSDPQKLYFSSKQSGILPLRFDEDKALWRDSAALFSFGSLDEDGTRAPAAFRWLALLIQELEDAIYLPKEKTYHYLALGLAKNRGKMLFARHETLPLPTDYLADTNLVRRLASALATAETVARDLLRAVRVAGMHLHLAQPEQVSWRSYGIHLHAPTAIKKVAEDEINGWVQHSGVERAYWAALDVPYQSFMVRLPAERDDALIGWQRQVRDAAFAAFDLIHQYTPDKGRSLKADVHGRAALAASLHKSLPLLYSLPIQEPTP